MGLDEHMKLLLQERRREYFSLLRGVDKDKKYNITFFGVGGVAKEAISSIANASSDLFIYPIKNIYLVGRDKEGSVQRRQRVVEQANELFGNRETRAIPKSTEELGKILPETDIFFFTARKTSLGKTIDRIKMTEQNKPLVDLVAKYFNKDFKGIINIVSNLPEGLAHYAATVFDIPDVRQITAHIPLDLRRLEYLINDSILKEEKYEKIDLVIVGYHDQLWPVISGAKLVRRYFVQKGTGSGEEIEYIAERLRESNIIDTLTQALNEYADRQFTYQKEEFKARGLPRTEGPTVTPTGRAVRDFIKAVINRENTITAIPYKMNNRWFFVDLPVTFERGYPLLNEEKFKDLTEEDLAQLYDRICGPYSEGKAMPLETVIDRNLGKNCNFDVPEDTKTLEKIFNPKGKPFTVEKKVIEIRPVDTADLAEKVESLEEEIRTLKETAGPGEEIRHLKELIQDLEEKKQIARELDKKLTESLDAKIYLPSITHKRMFTGYSLHHTVTPSVSEYELSLVGTPTDMFSMIYEHEKMSLGGLIVSGNKIYAVSERKHGDHTMEYRLFIYEEGDNRPIVSKPIRGKANDFALKDFAFNNNEVYFLKFENGKMSLVKYDVKINDLILMRDLDNEIGSIIPYKDDLILSSEHDFYLLDNEDLKLLHSSDERVGGVRSVSNTLDILFYNLPTKHKIIAADLTGSDIREFDTLFNAFDFVKFNREGIQILTANEEGALVDNYASKKDLFDDNGEKYLLKNHLLCDAKLFAQDKNVLFASREPNEWYAIYHNKGQMHIAKIGEIKDYSTLGAVVQKR